MGVHRVLVAPCGARPAWGRETSEALLRWSRQETRGLEQDGGQGGSRGRFRERFSDVGAGRLCWQIGCGVRENEVEHDPRSRSLKDGWTLLGLRRGLSGEQAQGSSELSPGQVKFATRRRGGGSRVRSLELGGEVRLEREIWASSA